MSACIFCRIVSKATPADVVYEDENVLAFHDIHPKYPVHVLIIPKAHLPFVPEADVSQDALLGKLLRIGAQIAAEKGITKTGFRLLTNAGPHSGQIVHHLHIHLIGGEPLRPL
jgi:histidine triad (HIT) family protein